MATGEQRRALLLVALAAVLANASWFSATAVVPARLIAFAAGAAGVTNLGLLVSSGLAVALPVRFLVGVALAGVYAPAVRLVATHFERGRGVATGVVVGALTLGSATPHLVRG